MGVKRELEIEHSKALKAGKTCGKIRNESKILPVLFIFQFFHCMFFCWFCFLFVVTFFGSFPFRFTFCSIHTFYCSCCCFVLFLRVGDYSVVIYILQEGLVESE